MMMIESPVGTTYELRPSSVDCVSSWAVRPINAVQRRPQTVQIRLLDGAASSELEFAARALRRLRVSYKHDQKVHSGVVL